MEYCKVSKIDKLYEVSFSTSLEQKNFGRKVFDSKNSQEMNGSVSGNFFLRLHLHLFI